MKFTAMIFAASIITAVSAIDSLAIGYYDKSPCASARVGIVTDLSTSKTTTCASALNTYKTALGTATCADLSQITNTTTKSYASYECLTDSASAWAKRTFTGSYLSSGIYSDKACTTSVGGLFIAADGACSSAGSTSYKVTVKSDGSVNLDTYTTGDCSGTASPAPIPSTLLSTCTGVSGMYFKYSLDSSAIRNAGALGFALIMALILAIF